MWSKGALENYAHFADQIMVVEMKARCGDLHAAAYYNCGVFRPPLAATDHAKRRRCQEILGFAIEGARIIEKGVIFQVDPCARRRMYLRCHVPLDSPALLGNLPGRRNTPPIWTLRRSVRTRALPQVRERKRR